MDVERRVAQYVQLRDHIKKLDDDHKEVVKPYKEMLEKLNNLMLEHLNNTGSDSIGSKAGTVYRTAKNSATLADPQAFMDYVIKAERWDLMDRKANSTAVKDFIDEEGVTPPGVNFSITHVVGVRRK